MLDIKPFVPAIILVAGYIMVSSGRGQTAVPLAAPIRSVLPAIDGYTTRDQKISDEERRVAGMTNYVARTYTRDSILAFTTLVSYYDRQTGGKSIHSPKNCLPGAGWEALSSGTQTLIAGGNSYLINRYMLKKGPARAVVYYWYQGRGRVVASEYAVKWNLLRDAAILGHTEEALVRVVVPIRPPAPGAQEATASVTEADSLGKVMAGRLIGEVNRILPRSGAA
jgi:EpsI family protein